MTTSIINRLRKFFGDRETRQAVATEYVAIGIPIQIHELREARGMTQTELAKKARMAAERISILEDPNYEFLPKIATLQRIAAVFDVPLIVRFGTWSELMGWQNDLSQNKLAPKTFDDEIKAITATSQVRVRTSLSQPSALAWLRDIPKRNELSKRWNVINDMGMVGSIRQSPTQAALSA